MLEEIRAAKKSGDFSPIVMAIPYFRFLGLTALPDEHGVICRLPADPRLIGNPFLPAVQGGVIGALLEAAALTQLVLQSETAALPKIINLAVDYLRSARPVETMAQGIVTRHGRRIANVRVEAWQDDRLRPVAAAHVHLLLS